MPHEFKRIVNGDRIRSRRPVRDLPTVRGKRLHSSTPVPPAHRQEAADRIINETARVWADLVRMGEVEPEDLSRYWQDENGGESGGA